MRNVFLSAAVMTAVFAASQASAAAVISNSSISLTPVGSSYVGIFGNLDPDQGTATGSSYRAFTDNFTFSLPAGVTGGSATGAVGTFGFRFLRTDVDFTSVTLNSTPFSQITEDFLGADLQLLSSTALTAGVQTLTVSGNSQRLGGYAGEITFTPNAVAAVPEPATWAMMIGGVGAIGGTLRRRRTKANVRVAFA